MEDEVPIYPYPLNMRWNQMPWFPFFHRRFLRSQFGLMSDLDVRGAALTLWAESMMERPAATLPDSAESLAFILKISLEDWRNLTQRQIPPLHGWRQYRCGNEIRLAHPFMLQNLETAIKSAKLRQRGSPQRKMWQPPDLGKSGE